MDNRRITPPADLDSFLDRLCEPPPLGLAIFETRQKALMFAAALGAYLTKEAELKQRGEGIRVDIFQRDSDDEFIDALAIWKKGELRVLRNENERVDIFEQYAYGGLLEMQRLIELDTTPPLEKLIALMQQGQASASSDVPGVDANVLALMR